MAEAGKRAKAKKDAISARFDAKKEAILAELEAKRKAVADSMEEKMDKLCKEARATAEALAEHPVAIPPGMLAERTR